MMYSPEERKKIKELLKAFGKFLRESKDYDVLYSKKAGYVWVGFIDDSSFVIESADDLLNMLIGHVYGRVCFESDVCGLHGDPPTPGFEEAEARHRLGAIFETIEGDRACCYEAMEQFFDACRGEA